MNYEKIFSNKYLNKKIKWKIISFDNQLINKYTLN